MIVHLCITQYLVDASTFPLRCEIRHDRDLRWHSNAKNSIDPYATQGKHLHHREMHDLAIKLKSYLLIDPLQTLTTDDLTRVGKDTKSKFDSSIVTLISIFSTFFFTFSYFLFARSY